MTDDRVGLLNDMFKVILEGMIKAELTKEQMRRVKQKFDEYLSYQYNKIQPIVLLTGLTPEKAREVIDIWKQSLNEL
jgi:methyltransferase-like protein